MTSTQSNGSTALVRTSREDSTIATTEPAARGLMRPIARPAEVLECLKETRDMLAKTLVDGDDYGAIPGTDKKVLLKPGAEKVAFSFGVRPEYEVVESDIDHERVMRFKSPWIEAPDPGKATKERLKAEGKGRSRKVDGEWQWQVPGDGYEEATGLYRYVIRCKLVRFDGAVIGEGVGSCSSLEGKYRSRPHEVENTVLKMAEKRAFVAAVLTSFGLSGAFTQDLEDTRDLEEKKTEQTKPTPPPARYVPGDVRKAKITALIGALGIEGDKQAYLKAVCGGDFPHSDAETDAAISELEARVAEKKRAESAAATDAVDGPNG